MKNKKNPKNDYFVFFFPFPKKAIKGSLQYFAEWILSCSFLHLPSEINVWGKPVRGDKNHKNVFHQ